MIFNLTKYIGDLVCIENGIAITGILNKHGFNSRITFYLFSEDQNIRKEINRFIPNHDDININLRNYDDFEDVSVDHVALAKRFLDPACLGEKHLSDHERARLRKIISNSESSAP